MKGVLPVRKRAHLYRASAVKPVYIGKFHLLPCIVFLRADPRVHENNDLIS